jgi:hypothetical protein
MRGYFWMVILWTVNRTYVVGRPGRELLEVPNLAKKTILRRLASRLDRLGETCNSLSLQNLPVRRQF